ncbi:MAG: hypothetical protein V3T70_00810 [Phycisphaerae bacterium]
MNRILQLLKKQWRLLALAVASFAALGVAGWQTLAAQQVVKMMERPVQIGRQLQQSNQMQNQTWIDEQQQRNAEDKVRFDELLKSARRRQLYNLFDGPDVLREPLVEGVLPAADKVQPKIEFRRRYKVAFDAMIKRLKSGDRPTAAELDEARTRYGEKQEAQRHLVSDAWAIARLAAVDTDDEASKDRVRALWNDPEVRFSLERARSIRIYRDERAIRTHKLAGRDEPPSVDDIWQAQMSLWIQQDLVRALVELNDDAATRHRDAGRADRTWVAHLPVKHLITMGVAGVLGGPAGGGGSNTKSMLYETFTRRGNNPDFFIVPIYLRIVVETAAIPRILDVLVQTSFMTPVCLNYTAVDPSWQQIGYVYGSEPVVELELNLEAYYLHSVYEAFMPETIQAQLTQPFEAAQSTGAPARRDRR